MGRSCSLVGSFVPWVSLSLAALGCGSTHSSAGGGAPDASLAPPSLGGGGGGASASEDAGLLGPIGAGGGGTCTSGGETTVTGTVYDPAGVNPLYDVLVFVPAATPPPFPSGVSCDQCASTVSQAVASALTGPDGTFTLKGVPAGANVPLVLQVGKWRRQVAIPNVAACQTTAVNDPTLLRLPKDHTEGDLPQMAIATGSIDPFECLLRKIGIADSEFTVPTGGGRVHMYQQNGSVLASGPVPGAELYASASTLEKYDLVIFPCEASPVTKDAASIQNLVDYTSAGGRVFATHYSYTWLDTLAPFDATATFAPNQPPLVSANATIDTSFPKGAAFAQWLFDVKASTTLGALTLDQVRFDVTGVGAGSQRWISTTPLVTLPGSTATQSIQHYTFNTPVDVDAGAQCGRVVYSDFHVVSSTTLAPGAIFPQPVCGNDTTMSPQEKALEFMFFDLSSCIQSDTQPPGLPPK
jgi:hypothetical protein